MIKIAFLTPEYPHPKTGNSGGIGSSIKNLAAGLIAQNCRVLVLVYGQNQDAIFDDDGVEIHQIKNVKFKGLSWFLTQKKIEKKINFLYKSDQIDLVEAPDWTGITSFIKPKCPILIRLHGCDTYFCHLDNRTVKWHNKFLEKRALQKADALLSVSEFTANLTNTVFGLNKKFRVIPNAIDTDFFSKNNKNQSTPEPVILYFGSIIRKKGLLELPHIFNTVFKENPTAKLLLIGRDVPDIMTQNSSTWAMMEALFDTEAKKSVTFLGAVPYQEIKKHIENASVCVFPSFAEALPLSWIEAMSLQKAIVASNIGWANEMITDGKNGFLENPKSHQAFAEKINILLSNPELCSVFGITARETAVRKFGIKSVSIQNKIFYETVIHSKK